jgi:hypothetical protein
MRNNSNLVADWIISAEELTIWAQVRNDNIPALTGPD